MDSNKSAHIKIIKELFKGRPDVYAQYWVSKKTGKKGYSPACKNKWKKNVCKTPCRTCPNANYSPLTDLVIENHLRGMIKIGIYPLLNDGTSAFIAVDFDDHNGKRAPLSDVKRFKDVCDVQEIHSHIERSSSGKGYHCWIFFKEAIPAWKSRLVIFALLKEAQVVDEEERLATFDRMFPNQNVLSGKELGNLITLPLQGNLCQEGNTVFLNPDNDYQVFPLEEQWDILNAVEKVDVAVFDRIIKEWNLQREDKNRDYEEQANVNQEGLDKILKCDFIEWCAQNQEKVSEPLWYAMVSNLGRFKAGREKIHAYSKNYPGYSQAETDAKIEHAVRDTGPHTCKYIRENGFNCKRDCGVKSPAGLSRNHSTSDTQEIDDEIRRLKSAMESGEGELGEAMQDLLKRQRILEKLIRDKIAPLFFEGNKGQDSIYRRVLKEYFDLSVQVFDKFLKTALSYLKQKKETQKQQKEEEEKQVKITRLLKIDTSLLKIHEKLAEITSSPYSHDCIELVLATNISLSSSNVGTTLWLITVGNPSSDKTQVVLTIKDVPNVLYLDTLTENAFVSGYIAADGSIPQDLLSVLDGKCLVVKDWTTLFSLRSDVIKKILGDLAAIYDGTFSKWTGTRGHTNYIANFTHVGCITPIALSQHQHYLSIIGSRFLFYRVLPLTTEERKEGYSIIWDNDRETLRKKKDELREKVSAYACRLLIEIDKKRIDIPKISKEDQEKLSKYAEMLRRGRAAVRTERIEGQDREGKPFVTYQTAEVQIEEPWRAVQQLRTLVLMLAIVHGRGAVTTHELEMARRVVLSSMPVDRATVLALYQQGDYAKNGLTRKDCADGIHKARNQAVRLLTELEEIGLLEKVGGEQGMDTFAYTYFPNMEFEEILAAPVHPTDHILDLTQNSP